MKPSKRILFVGGAFELLLAGIAIWLMAELDRGNFRPANNLAETTSTIFSVIGGLMGGLGGLFVVLHIVLKRRGS